LRQKFGNALWIDLVKTDVFRRFSARPETVNELLDRRKADESRTVIIDEVQKLPEILGLVHAIIEEKHGWQFILTGSSARKLKRAGVDLLAGRAVLRTFHPFMASELGPRFSLEQALAIGCVPLIVSASRPEDVLSTYIDLYINEEVKMEGLLRSTQRFVRAIIICRRLSGEHPPASLPGQ
jgi:predicted AAA+ superfamily ATPase